MNLAEFVLSRLIVLGLGRKYPGTSVVVEGGSGAGKDLLVKNMWMDGLQLEEEGWRVFREPGGTKFATLTREMVQGLDNEHFKLKGKASLMMYSAARADLYEKEVLPGQRNGEKHLLNRSWLSGAYQIADGVRLPYVVWTAMIMTGGLIPDLILYLDVEPEIAERRKPKKMDLDRFDVRPIEYHREVRQIYKNLGQLFLGLGVWTEVDASGKPENTLAQAVCALESKRLIGVGGGE